MKRLLKITFYVVTLLFWLIASLGGSAVGFLFVVVVSVVFSMAYVPLLIRVSAQYGMPWAVITSAALLTFCQAWTVIYGMLEHILPSVKKEFDSFAQDMPRSFDARSSVINDAAPCAQDDAQT